MLLHSLLMRAKTTWRERRSQNKKMKRIASLHVRTRFLAIQTPPLRRALTMSFSSSAQRSMKTGGLRTILCLRTGLSTLGLYRQALPTKAIETRKTFCMAEPRLLGAGLRLRAYNCALDLVGTRKDVYACLPCVVHSPWRITEQHNMICRYMRCTSTAQPEATRNKNNDANSNLKRNTTPWHS